MTTTPLYASRFAGLGYDLVARTVFSPVGGLARLRAEALDTAAVAPGDRVLELGCGTGGFTRLLVGRGAVVTSVDRAPTMLARARRRAAGATFVEHEVASYPAAPGAFDAAWCAFVLHELSRDARAATFAGVHAALAPTGRLVIVEHAVPERGVVARLVSRVVHGFEPPTLVSWLRDGLMTELLEAGFAIAARRTLARGAAVVVVCAPR
jgi:ubiquinone/menaquinone biosynthesis C-methylase UbiE